METIIALPVFREDSPLYEQLYRHLAGEISHGRLPSGSKLPSKRKMCVLLGISKAQYDKQEAE